MRARRGPQGAAVLYHPEADEVSHRIAPTECKMKEIYYTNTEVQVTRR